MSISLFPVFTLFLLLALTATAVTSSTGVYYIDDTDPSIKWNGPFIHLNSSFAPITWADAADCFDNTL